jgi:LmbE family N-acetylglucosaminyl deacetylase
MAHSEAPQSFEPADPGTSEDAWQRLLCAAPEWAPRQAPLIVVAPHPDDEVLGAGGLIHAWASAGRPVTILSVTDGEASDPERRGLDRIRRKELQDALRVLTPVHVNVRRAAIPDGKVVEHANRLRDALEALVTPDATIIAPYEHDRHPDHEMAGWICAQVARIARVPLARYPVWTWHHTDPVTLKSVRWGRFSLSAAARRAKSSALRCFVSQLRPPSGPPILPGRVLAHFQRPYEAFVV